MTQDEIIRMAREAGYQSVYLSDAPIGRSYQFLERFAALVAAHEREKQHEQEPMAWMHKEGLITDYGSIKCGDKPLYYAPTISCQFTTELVDIEAAVLAEREACAKVCSVDNYIAVRMVDDERIDVHNDAVMKCAKAIRARSENASS